MADARETWAKAIAEFDSNGDGTIDFDEFKQLID